MLTSIRLHSPLHYPITPEDRSLWQEGCTCPMKRTKSTRPWRLRTLVSSLYEDGSFLSGQLTRLSYLIDNELRLRQWNTLAINHKCFAFPGVLSMHVIFAPVSMNPHLNTESPLYSPL